ncbi:hypothetical protein AAHC03_05798 [Spirometra sp. Aus1]
MAEECSSIRVLFGEAIIVEIIARFLSVFINSRRLSTVWSDKDEYHMVKTEIDRNASNIFIRWLGSFKEIGDTKNYFSQFGRIINIYRAVSPDTGAPLGFGFISFVHGTDLREILLTKRHSIGHGSILVRKYNPPRNNRGNGRRFDLQPLLPDEGEVNYGATVCAHDDAGDRARPNKGGQQKTQSDPLQFFLSGVKNIITSDMLEDYFSQIGQVLHLHMITDLLTKKPGGSGYLTLRTKMDADTILGMQHNVNGVRINVRKRGALKSGQNASIRCPLCPVNTHVANQAPRSSKQLHSPASSPVCQACKELSPTLKLCEHCSRAICSVCTCFHQHEAERCKQSTLSTGYNRTQIDRNGNSTDSVTSQKGEVVAQLARKLKTLRSKRAELIALKTSLAKPNCGRNPCKKRLIREITSATDQLYCHAVHAFETANAHFTSTSAQEQTLLVKLRQDCTDLKERKSALILKARGIRWSNNSARLNEFKVSASRLLEEADKLRKSVHTCEANGISKSSVSHRFETIHLQLRDFHLVTCDSVSFPETGQSKRENRCSSNTPATPSPQPSCMTPSTVPACCSSSSQAVAAAAAASPANSTVVNRYVN